MVRSRRGELATLLRIGRVGSRGLSGLATRDRGLKTLVTQLMALHFFDWTTIFGAELLWSALPFIIVLSSLADTRIDDDLSRHIGLNSRGAHIVETLFRNSPSHAVLAIVAGLLVSFAGVKRHRKLLVDRRRKMSVVGRVCGVVSWRG